MVRRNRINAYRSDEIWFRSLLAGRFQDVVFTTGDGIVRLASLGAKLGVLGEFISALGRARRIAIGPASKRALVNLELAPELFCGTLTAARSIIWVFWWTEGWEW